MLASGNKGKLRELVRLLAGLDVEVVPQSEFDVPDADESGTTFSANAEIKARHASAATGLPAISDDSGLSVDALGGRPGVLTARYAGIGASDDDNIDKLLEELDGESNRGASFHCVACYVESPQAPAVATHGEWRGEILEARRGSGGARTRGRTRGAPPPAATACRLWRRR